MLMLFMYNSVFQILRVYAISLHVWIFALIVCVLNVVPLFVNAVRIFLRRSDNPVIDRRSLICSIYGKNHPMDLCLSHLGAVEPLFLCQRIWGIRM